MLHETLVALPRRYKRLLMVLADSAVFPVLVMASLALRLDMSRAIPLDIWLLPAASLVTVPLLWVFGVYHGMIRQPGGELMRGAALGSVLGAMALASLAYMVPAEFVSRSLYVIYGLLAITYLAASRFFVRWWLTRAMGDNLNRQPVAIFGAGEAGIQVAAGLNTSKEYQARYFVDDNAGLHGTRIRGIRVLSRKQLQPLLESGEIATVLLAIPSASRSKRMEVVRFLEQYPVSVKSVPALPDIIAGRAQLQSLRDVAIEDLLGRDSVAPREDLLGAAVSGKRVLVTGAGGSIGSELSRQLAQLRPLSLVLMDVSEFALYQIERELAPVCESLNVALRCVLGSVTDSALVERVLVGEKINTIYHAAAYKHVPMVEHNECVGCANNVLGTAVVAQLAEQHGVERFVLVSTDKAVRPTNVMGATKRLAEMVLQGLAPDAQNTVFTMVRFGNVLGSSGSVVPLFREQIRAGGPVTVTHPDVTRYFMTIPEAAQLVLQAGAMATGGEVFVLDMGEPVRIQDLAQTMVRLMGMSVRDDDNPDGDIAIVFTGLRPGEKLYEELLIGESSVGTAHPRILQAQEERLDWPAMAVLLAALEEAVQRGDAAAIRAHLAQHVHGYGQAPELPPGAQPRQPLH
ncbi:MAG: polysaccharide biosynthesis protein [Alcanivoracaceae bacterium]